MQLPYMYLEIGGVLTDITDHDNAIASLASFSVDWGTDSPDSQPEPSVLTFSLRDRTGALAGRATELMGSRVVLYLTAPPTWADMTRMGAWADQGTATLATLHQRYRPMSAVQPDPLMPVVFAGEIQSGGTVTQRADDKGWLIELSASSQLITWKRMQKQGPVSSAAKYEGQHWVGTPASRLETLNTRASEAGAPTASTGDLSLPNAVAAYETNSSPSQLDLLHRLFAHDHRLPLWYERPRWTRSTIEPTDLTTPVTLTATSDGRMLAVRGDRTGVCLDAGKVTADASLEISEPVTQVTVTAKAAKASDGKLEWEESELIYGGRGRLPDNLTRLQSSVTKESDAVVADESGGLLDGGTTALTDAQREQAAAWLAAWDTRLKPETVTIDALDIDPANQPDLYRCYPPPPITFDGSRFHRLSAGDGQPAFSAAWLAIGGLLGFDWVGGRPRLRHELTIIPLPHAAATSPIPWSGLDGWTAQWQSVRYSWTELAAISTVTKTKEG
ncbi:hypothetical protein BLEM_0609 [Bifidobacterium lemurum]|uniref:Uncharacterized protein n=1 Tax=Bifidobacterium lemurum TaxID=1603886 RepID=A0A261FU33_9BIFI|nr:hypothetical protein [Bifidobacterium lemurum]OZG62692.1 hypothetical protein BLEM_0609 [Bifidobacterium lemurum]QOL34591.1 hypothetical protein BL8807_01255 [Bifidobacterium lemurum]